MQKHNELLKWNYTGKIQGKIELTKCNSIDIMIL